MDSWTAQMKNRLMSEKQELLDSLSQNDINFTSMNEQKSGNDEIDEAADTIDRKILDALGEKDLNRLKLIDSALMRIEQGKYGLCIKCGKRIPKARMEAIPSALLCIDCKSRNEWRGR